MINDCFRCNQFAELSMKWHVELITEIAKEAISSLKISLKEKHQSCIIEWIAYDEIL